MLQDSRLQHFDLKVFVIDTLQNKVECCDCVYICVYMYCVPVQCVSVAELVQQGMGLNHRKDIS